jgi:hypothetical protein
MAPRPRIQTQGRLLFTDAIEARRAATWFRCVARAAGLSVAPATALGAMAAQVMRYANGLDGYRPTSLDDRIEGRRTLSHMYSLGAALEVAPRIRGFNLKRKHIRNLPDPRLTSNTQRERQQQDHFFEIEVAAALHLAGMPVELAEPDLRVGPLADVPGAPFVGVPCKRTREHGTGPGAIRKACEQVTRSGMPGVVFMNVDRHLNPTNPETGRPMEWYTTTKEQFLESAVRRLRASATVDVGKAPGAENVLGFVWWASVGAVLASGDEAGSYLHERAMVRQSRDDHPWAAEVVARLCLAVFSSQGAVPYYRSLWPGSPYRRTHAPEQWSRWRNAQLEDTQPPRRISATLSC